MKQLFAVFVGVVVSIQAPMARAQCCGDSQVGPETQVPSGFRRVTVSMSKFSVPPATEPLPPESLPKVSLFSLAKTGLTPVFSQPFNQQTGSSTPLFVPRSAPVFGKMDSGSGSGGGGSGGGGSGGSGANAEGSNGNAEVKEDACKDDKADLAYGVVVSGLSIGDGITVSEPPMSSGDSGSGSGAVSSVLMEWPIYRTSDAPVNGVIDSTTNRDVTLSMYSETIPGAANNPIVTTLSLTSRPFAVVEWTISNGTITTRQKVVMFLPQEEVKKANASWILAGGAPISDMMNSSNLWQRIPARILGNAFGGGAMVLEIKPVYIHAACDVVDDTDLQALATSGHRRCYASTFPDIVTVATPPQTTPPLPLIGFSWQAPAGTDEGYFEDNAVNSFGSVRQVYSHGTLLEITPNSSAAIQLSFKRGVTPLVNQQLIASYNSNVPAHTTWAVTQTSSTTLVAKRFISNVADAQETETWQQNGTGTSAEWTFTKLVGQRLETQVKSENFKSVKVEKLGGPVVSYTETVRTADGLQEKTTEGLGALTRTTVTTNIPNPDGTYASTRVERSDGWFEERVPYTPAGATSPTGVKILSGWQDEAPSAGEANLRVRIEDHPDTQTTSVTESIAGKTMLFTTTTTGVSSPSSQEGGHMPASSRTTVRTRPDGTYTVASITTYPQNAPQPFAGRIATEMSEDGSQTDYAYYLGRIDAAPDAYPELGSFKQNEAGGTDLKVEITRAQAGTRTVRYEDAAGRVRLVEEKAFTDGAFETYRVTRHKYDAEGHRAGSQLQTQDGWRTTYSAQWGTLTESGRTVTETDELGVTTATQYDAEKKVRQITRTAIGSLPEQVTVRDYDLLGRLASETITSGGLKRESKRLYDVLGNLESESVAGPVPENAITGATLTTTYNNAGEETLGTISFAGTEQITVKRKLLKRFNPGAGATPSSVTTYYRDGSIKSLSGSAERAAAYSQAAILDTAGNGVIKQTTSLIGVTPPITTEKRTDGFGRIVWEQEAGVTPVETIYDNFGRPSQKKRNGTTLREFYYDFKGELEHEIVYAAPNQEFWYSSYFEKEGARWWRVRTSPGMVSRDLVGGFGPNDLSVQQTTPDGKSTTSITEILGEAATVTRSVTTEGSGESTSVSQAGILVRTTAPNGQQVNYTPDGFGRPTEIYDVGRQIRTTITYDPVFGREDTITTVGENSALTSASTVTHYDYFGPGTTSSGRVSAQTTDSRTIRFVYDAHGRTTHTWGATYPLLYEYDGAGRLWKLHTFQRTDLDFFGTTWPANAGDGNVTEWIYHDGTNLVWKKRYPKKADEDAKETVYTYENGRVKTRTWARLTGGQPIVTTYNYDLAGTLTGVIYSDGTPNVDFTPDTKGRVAQVTDGTGTRTLLYRSAESRDVQDEFSDQSWSLHYSYDTKGRRDGSTLSTPNGQHVSSWGYHPETGLVSGVATAAGQAIYGYRPGTNWLETTTYSAADGTVKITRTPDAIFRLKKVQTAMTRPSGAQPPANLPWSSHEYVYQNGLRKQALLGDNTRWAYDYNDRAEVTGGTKYVDSGSTVLQGLQFGYEYDAIGNRVLASRGNRSGRYTPNELNQYKERVQPVDSNGLRGLELIGDADPAATVSVQVGTTNYSAERQGSAFRSSIPVGGTDRQWLSVKTTALANQLPEGSIVQQPELIQQESTGHAYVPSKTEPFTFDDDGNLTLDDRWSYEWDAENRLRSVTTRSEAVTAGAPNTKVVFTYDWMGRRFEKAVYEGTASSLPSQPTRSTRFIYDGWNLLAELNLNAGGTAWNLGRRYAWGVDLSGSMQGAGGVGGLLSISEGNTGESVAYVPAYDGNGNITALIRRDAGWDFTNAAAVYEYGPFGEPVGVSGSMANGNPFQFSTKYTDIETGLIYYGLRYYQSATGRWLSSDPLEEQGGVNMMAFVNNASLSYIDPIGLAACICEYVDGFTAKFTPRWVAQGFGGGIEADLYVRPRLNYTKVERQDDSVEALLSWHELAYFDEKSASGKDLMKRYEGMRSAVDYDVTGSDAWKKNTSTKPWWDRAFVRTGHKSYQAGDPSGQIHDDARTFMGTTQSIRWSVKVASSPACARLKDKKYQKGYLVEAEFTVQSEFRKTSSIHLNEDGYMSWGYTVWEMDGDTKIRKVTEDGGEQRR